MTDVVNHDGELVGPVASAIENQEIAALLGGILCLSAEKLVLERLSSSSERDPNPMIGLFWPSFAPAVAAVSAFAAC